VTAEEAVAQQKGVIRLLDTDNEVVLPTGRTSASQSQHRDVIHSWTVPSLRHQRHDATPGRVNESWSTSRSPASITASAPELCGIQHAYMPIKVHAVTPEEFDAWVKQAQGKFDKAPEAEPRTRRPRPRPARSRKSSRPIESGFVPKFEGHPAMSPVRNPPRCPRRSRSPPDRHPALTSIPPTQGHRYDVPGVRGGGRLHRRPVSR